MLVGHLTFSCLGDVPTWLNEGLAVYSEGELDPASQQQLDDAIRDDTLLTVRSLSGGFSEVADKAYLSYSQSYSLVKFLIETYGQDKMTSLLVALRDGVTIDEALTQTYGFNVDGLEDAWRQAIGAPRTFCFRRADRAAHSDLCSHHRSRLAASRGCPGDRDCDADLFLRETSQHQTPDVQVPLHRR